MNLFALSGLLTGFTCLCMAIYVYSKRYLNPGNIHWSFLCLSVAVWGFGGYFIGTTEDPSRALIFWKISYLGVTFIPVLYYDFIHVFLGKRRELKLYSSYALSIIFLTLTPTALMIQSVEKQFDEFYYLSSPGILYPYFVFYFIVVVLISHIDLWRFLKKNRDAHKAMQVKWFFLASVVGFSGGISCFPLVFGVKLYPYGNFTVAAYPIIMSYAIIKHQLLDIQIVIKRTIFYSFLVFLTSILYVTTVAITHRLLLGQWSPQVYIVRGLSQAISLLENIFMNWFTFSSFVCGASSFCLAVFAFIVGKTKAQRLFVLFNVAVAMWGFGNFIAGASDSPERIILGWRAAYLGGFFISTLFCHMTFVLFEIKIRRFLILAYTQSIVLTVLMFLFPQSLILDLRRVYGISYNVVTPVMAVGIFMYFLIVGRTFFSLLSSLRGMTGQRIKQAKFFLFGFALGFIGGGTTLLPVFGINSIYPAGNLAVAIYVVILLYAIFRHQVLDVHIALKKTIFYSLLALSISSGYVFLIFILHKLFLFEGSVRPTLPNSILLIVVIMLFLKPIETFLHKFLDKKFFSGTISQIAEQKEMLVSELERAERLKAVGVLAAGMAHEIKNPITALKTFAEYLPQRYDEPGFRETLAKVMKNESERIEALVRNLLVFSKPSEPSKVECSVSRILRDIIELVSAELARTGIVVVERLDDSAICYADPEQLRQAFLNLILNARDAMQGVGGKLTISTRSDVEKVEIAIEDSGCGIAQNKIAHIFDPFYTDKDGGTGLGLAITHSIIEKNGGKILVESVEQIGSRFIINLPKAPK